MQCRSWWKESDLNNAVDSSAARLGFIIFFFFSVKFMGWGFCRTWHWDLISNEDLLVRKFDLTQPSFIASRIEQNKVPLLVHVQRCLPEAHETPCGSCDGRAKRAGTFLCPGFHSAAPADRKTALGSREERDFPKEGPNLLPQPFPPSAGLLEQAGSSAMGSAA